MTSSSPINEENFLKMVKSLYHSINQNKFWDKKEVELLQKFLEGIEEKISFIESNLVNKTPTSKRIYKIYKGEVWIFDVLQSFYDFSFKYKLVENKDYEFAKDGETLGINSVEEDFNPMFNGIGYVDVATSNINFKAVKYATARTGHVIDHYPVRGSWFYSAAFNSTYDCLFFPPLLWDDPSYTEFNWNDCHPNIRNSLNGTIEFRNEGDNKVWFYEGKDKPAGYNGLVCRMVQNSDEISIVEPATITNPKTYFTFPAFTYFKIGQEPQEPVPLPPRLMCVFVKFLRDLDLQ